MKRPGDYRVLDSMKSRCVDCIHDKICERLKTIEGFWDPFVGIRVAVLECGAHLAGNQLVQNEGTSQ